MRHMTFSSISFFRYPTFRPSQECWLLLKSRLPICRHAAQSQPQSPSSISEDSHQVYESVASRCMEAYRSKYSAFRHLHEGTGWTQIDANGAEIPLALPRVRYIVALLGAHSWKLFSFARFLQLAYLKLRYLALSDRNRYCQCQMDFDVKSPSRVYYLFVHRAVSLPLRWLLGTWYSAVI